MESVVATIAVIAPTMAKKMNILNAPIVNGMVQTAIGIQLLNGVVLVKRKMK